MYTFIACLVSDKSWTKSDNLTEIKETKSEMSQVRAAVFMRHLGYNVLLIYPRGISPRGPRNNIYIRSNYHR